MGDFQGRVLYLLLLLPAFVAAFTIHEFAHAWMGHRLGDDTARRMGRLTLDPVVHLDPWGSLIMVIAMLTGAPLIGWAKPVPFNPRNLDHPRRDAMLIALAGPISNVLQAMVWFVLLLGFRFFAERAGVNFASPQIEGILNRVPDVSSVPTLIATMMAAGVTVNIGLAAFNMLPLPPLDGHYVLEYLGPPSIEAFFDSIRPYSFLILLVLLQTPVFRVALQPFDQFADAMVLRAFGESPSNWTYFNS